MPLFPRVRAAEILRQLADDVEIGQPPSVDEYELGRALQRAIGNASPPWCDTLLVDILHGWFERELA